MLIANGRPLNSSLSPSTTWSQELLSILRIEPPSLLQFSVASALRKARLCSQEGKTVGQPHCLRMNQKSRHVITANQHAECQAQKLLRSLSSFPRWPPRELENPVWLSTVHLEHCRWQRDSPQRCSHMVWVKFCLRKGPGFYL